jgi:hypothetical protein
MERQDYLQLPLIHISIPEAARRVIEDRAGLDQRGAVMLHQNILAGINLLHLDDESILESDELICEEDL